MLLSTVSLQMTQSTHTRSSVLRLCTESTASHDRDSSSPSFSSRFKQLHFHFGKEGKTANLQMLKASLRCSYIR